MDPYKICPAAVNEYKYSIIVPFLIVVKNERTEHMYSDLYDYKVQLSSS